MNPYLFIVGCPRSGTTLLRRMVDAHPLIAIPSSEQHWLAKWFERRRGVTHEGLVRPELMSELLSYEKFVRTGIAREDLERLIAADKPPTYSSFVRGVFDLYGEARGKPLAGDKTPGNVRFIPTLHGLWPEARFVHIIRDGRSVSLSLINWERASKLARRHGTWAEDPVTTSAVWWERQVRRGREDGGALDKALYHEVRYESLVEEPSLVCRSLCEFLGVPYNSAMLRFHEGKTKTASGLSAKKAWLPVTAGLRDWRSEMSPEDLERFEAAAGDLLDELGYERACPRPSQLALKHASETRQAFIQDLQQREQRP